MKKNSIYLIIAIIIVLGAMFFVKTLFYQGEDGWIRDTDGLWIEHGNPTFIPDEVRLQYDAILCGFTLYSQEKAKNKTFDSECLGRCGTYAVDVVNVPRTSLDDLPENQCEDFLAGTTDRVIEIDKDANIVRIID